LSDDISGIKVSDTLDFQYISNSGTILIGSEQISYASKDTLANIIRGTSSTLPATHQNGSTVFLLPSTPIVTNTLTNDITVNSTEIKCDNVITSAPPGYILIDSEIIKYETISQISLILTNITRGSFNTTIATHSTGSTVYFIPTPVASSLISQSNPMSETDMIVSLVSNANFTSSGTILIDSEIMTYTSKNALGDLVRGVNSTNPQGYPNNTPLELLNITLTVKDSSIIVDTSANNMTIDLPDAINIKGRIYTVKKLVSANTVSINPYGTQTIDNALNYNLLLTNAFISFQSDGANWKIISNSNFDALGAAVDALTTANNYTDQEINTVKYRTIEEVSQDVSITNPVTTTESVCIINTYPTTFNINQVLSFTVNNVNIVAGDLIFTQVITPDTDDVPFISIRNITTGSFVMSMRNITGGVIPITSQKISFQIIKKA